MFTADMNHAIRFLSEVLKDAFKAVKNGEFGVQIQEVTLRLFDEWLARGSLPRMPQTVHLVTDVIKKNKDVELVFRLIFVSISP